MSKALFEKAYRESRAADAPVFVDDVLVLKADGDYFHVLTQRLYAAFEWGLAAQPEIVLPKSGIRAGSAYIERREAVEAAGYTVRREE